VKVKRTTNSHRQDHRRTTELNRAPATERGVGNSEGPPPSVGRREPARVPSRVEPTLIEPSIPPIADLLKSGAIDKELRLTNEELEKIASPTAEEMARSIIAGTGWPLRPFIESPTLPKLGEVLKSHPQLYWHPLVQGQVRYLHRLRSDNEEWKRLGWQWESKFDGEYEVYTSPKEVALVNEQLANLIEAHAAGLLPQKRIQWKRARRRPGPKGGLKNPYPTWEPWSERISAEEIAADFHALRSAFKRRLDAAEGKPRTKTGAKEWYRELAQQVLESSSVACLESSYVPCSSVPWWSGYRDFEHAAHPSGWKPLNLDTALDAMLNGRMGRAGREGKPAYLAYAVLGSLLDATPEKIRNTIGNYRHPRHVKKSR